MPSSIFEIIISMVIMASSTRRPRAMMSAPREMRCRLMSIAFMLTKTMASTSGIDRATTTPGFIPRLRKLTTRTMAIASKSALVELIVEERSDHTFRQGGLDVADLLADLVPDVRQVALGCRLLEIHEDRRLAGLRVALDIVETRRFLELLFESRHLLESVLGGRARPGDLDDHG